MTSISRQHALATAERLLNPEEILAAVPAGGFLNGLAGTALLHARLSAVDPVFAQAALRHWTAASQHPGPHRAAAGVFSNPGGLAASLIIGSAYLPDPDSQRAVTARAVRWLAARAVDLAHGREEHLRAGGVGTPWPIYDAINGLAGIGRVLLAALTAGSDTAESGLLSLLARAHAAGWSVAGQRAAIQSVAHWLLRWRTGAAHSWAPCVTGEELDSDTAAPTTGRRDAWCYGAPGIGRALTLAGSALADPRLTTVGEAAIASLAEHPADLWDVEGPTLCHCLHWSRPGLGRRATHQPSQPGGHRWRYSLERRAVAVVVHRIEKVRTRGECTA